MMPNRGGNPIDDKHFLHAEAEELAHVGSWISCLTGAGGIQWSRECHRLFGISEGTPISLELYFSLVHPDDIGRVRETRRAAIEDGAPYALEYRIVRQDGSLRWVQAKATVERDDAGRPLRLIGVFQDVTELRTLIDELRRSEARYRRIIETTNEGVWTIDAEDRTTFVNARMAGMLGYEVSELAGRRALDFVAPEARARFELVLANHHAGLGEQLEVPLVRKDGTLLTALLEATPIFDAAGNYEGALAMVADVTERRRTEEAVKKGQEALLASEEQLRHAQKMEAIGLLAGGVAHDFNNLLSVIMSYSALAIDDIEPGAPLRADLLEVMAAARRAGELTRQLLAFSRRQVLQPRVIDLNETISGMEKMLRRLIGEDVELRLDLAPGLGCVHADPGQLEQVVMNLAVNARDAMPRGGTLTLETAGTDASDGPRIRLSVGDTGTGMDERTRARIFEPFFTTKERDRGTGLGLSTVLGIVEQSGGSIDVESEPGRGTRFDILLPRTSGTPAVRRSLVPSPGTLCGSETILLVEDDEQVRRLARVILERSGYRVIEASNAGEALLIAEDPSHRFDLLLTDVVMPRCTGHALARRLRAQRPELPVLYMSGYPDNSIATYGVLTPGIRLLHKPLQPVPLLAAVRSVLDAPPGIELPATG